MSHLRGQSITKKTSHCLTMALYACGKWRPSDLNQCAPGCVHVVDCENRGHFLGSLDCPKGTTPVDIPMYRS